MARPTMARIQRICGDCGVCNTIVTPEIRPSWTIHCSSCGAVLIERRRFRPRLVQPVREQLEAVCRASV